jgi:hypothetical protein
VDVIAATLVGSVLSLGLALGGALVYSLPVMWLWNAVMPEMFGMKHLDWVEALWLSLLCAFLFRTTPRTSAGGS